MQNGNTGGPKYNKVAANDNWITEYIKYTIRKYKFNSRLHNIKVYF